jgi:hypothetical protein
MNSRRLIGHPLKLLGGAAYRGQGRMGTGCFLAHHARSCQFGRVPPYSLGRLNNQVQHAMKFNLEVRSVVAMRLMKIAAGGTT